MVVTFKRKNNEKIISLVLTIATLLGCLVIGTSAASKSKLYFEGISQNGKEVTAKLILDDAASINITTSNYMNHQGTLINGIRTLSAECLGIQKVSVDLMGVFALS